MYIFLKDLEPVITEYSETLLRKLDDDDKEIDHLLARIERDEVSYPNIFIIACTVRF
jgi:hypothetical protein